VVDRVPDLVVEIQKNDVLLIKVAEQLALKLGNVGGWKVVLLSHSRPRVIGYCTTHQAYRAHR